MTHLPMKGRRRLAIYLIRVAGALVETKGMNNHSNNPSLVLKVFFAYMSRLDWNLVASQLEVEFSKGLSTFQIIDDFINPWKRVSLLH